MIKLTENKISEKGFHRFPRRFGIDWLVSTGSVPTSLEPEQSR